MRTLLHTTAKSLGLPFTIFSYPSHGPWLDMMANKSRRGVLLLDDYFSIATVDDAVRRSYFVMGIVRPPCDWEVSNWAYESDLHYLHMVKPGRPKLRRRFPEPFYDNHMLGSQPPYNASDDVRRFRAFLHDPLRRGDSLEYRLRVRYTGDDLRAVLTAAAHCWMWIDSLTQDLAKCLEQYASCGGERFNMTAWLQENEMLHDFNPSSRVSCPAYYEPDDRALIMSRNPSLTAFQRTMHARSADVFDHHHFALSGYRHSALPASSSLKAGQTDGCCAAL